MILSEKIEIKVHRTNIEHFRKLGYIDLKIRKPLLVYVKDLMYNSNYRILVKCDNCGEEKEIKYQDYNKCTNNQEENYYCSKCKSIRYKETCMEKWGVDNSFKSEEIKVKIKERLLNIYGVDHPMKSEEITEKTKKTNIERYGVDNPLKLEFFRNKGIEKSKIKYGTDFPSQSDEIKNKMKTTNVEKYGVEYCFQNEEIYNKFKNTMIERYGADNAMAINDFYEKSRKGGLKRKYFKDTDINYQGKYELDFLKKYSDKISIKNGKSIKYFFENKYRWYYSDFYIEEKNLIVEIKSTYWYNNYLKKNIEKEKECIKQGYNYIIILDKNYDEFDKL